MLLHNDVVTDGEPKPGPFSGRLGGEERVEHLFFDFRWNTRAVIPNSDFHTIAKASCRGHQSWFIIIAISLASTLCGRIKAVRDQVQKHPREILRKYVGLPSGRVQRSFERYAKPLLLGPRAMVGKVQALLDDGIDIDNPVLA